MTKKANSKIREKAKRAGVPYWQIADKIGTTESTFLRWIRHELPKEKQAEILKAIEEISTEKQADA